MQLSGVLPRADHVRLLIWCADVRADQIMESYAEYRGEYVSTCNETYTSEAMCPQ